LPLLGDAFRGCTGKAFTPDCSWIAGGARARAGRFMGAGGGWWWWQGGREGGVLLSFAGFVVRFGF